MSKKALVCFSSLVLGESAGWASAGQETFDPLSIAADSQGCSLCISGLMESSSVPPFRAGQRDTAAGRVAGQWVPHPSVRLRAQVERLRMQWPSGETASGWGDVRLGTSGTFWKGASGGPELGLDWSMKLPNAADEGELGSDESDVSVGLFGLFQAGPWWFGVSGSLLILGDPLQFANQDDALLLGSSVAFHREQWRVMSRLVWREESPRNPRDIRWLTGVRWSGLPGGLWLAAEGGAGFAVASPTWQAGLTFGISRACRAPNWD